jgi:hypothetical protein
MLCYVMLNSNKIHFLIFFLNFFYMKTKLSCFIFFCNLSDIMFLEGRKTTIYSYEKNINNHQNQ